MKITSKMNKYASLLLLLIVFITASQCKRQAKTDNESASYKGTYRDSTANTDRRVADLLSRMTTEEKIGQLLCLFGWEMYTRTDTSVTISKAYEEMLRSTGAGMLWGTLRADPWTKKTLTTGLNPYMSAEALNALQRYAVENTRLGIPLLFAEECAHGHMAIGTTVFPTSIGQGSTWDPELIEKMARAIAAEVRSQGAHIGYGPILDLAREPRWSRMEETFGEDPYLISRMGVAVVTGLQGDGLKDKGSVISTLKHFYAYGIPEGGHNGGIVSIGTRELFQNCMYPFHQAVKAGAVSIMTSYNSVNGIPCTADNYTLKTVVRDRWGFDGFFVADLDAIGALVTSHRVAETTSDAAAMSLNAGVDVDLGGNSFITLKEALEKGTISMSDIDIAVKRVLKKKFEMGLFENPYVDALQAQRIGRSEEHIDLARQVARESIILLKNENGLLPLNKDIRSIAVIGPNADNMYNQLGDYTAPQDDKAIVTVLEGIKNSVGEGTAVTYVKGCAIRDTTTSEIAEAVKAAKKADVAVVVLGGSSARDFKTDYANTGAATIPGKNSTAVLSDMECGEGYDRADLAVMGHQVKLLDALLRTGTPIVVVLIEGRPLNLRGLEQKAQNMILAWYPGQEGGNAIADVLFGDYNPAGRLPVSVPASVGQLPVYYNNISPARHNYLEASSAPLFCFGHGLSYTSFGYSGLNITASENKESIKVSVSFRVKNTGNREGDEVVQLYIRDNVSSVVTEEKKLRRFQRTHLSPGEEKAISFEIDNEDLCLYDEQMNRIVEPGSFNIMIGASSEDIRLSSAFEIKSLHRSEK